MMSFTKAINQFFGKKPGQTTQEFGKEIGSLTSVDKKEMAQMLANEMEDSVELSFGEEKLLFEPA